MPWLGSSGNGSRRGGLRKPSGGSGWRNLHLPLTTRAAVLEPSMAPWGFCCSDTGEREGSKSQEMGCLLAQDRRRVLNRGKTGCKEVWERVDGLDWGQVSKEKQMRTTEGMAAGERENPCSREGERGENATVQGK